MDEESRKQIAGMIAEMKASVKATGRSIALFAQKVQHGAERRL